MLEQGDRPYYIVNIASAGGLVPIVPNNLQSHYYASKAGVINYTRALAKEYLANGIHVNCIAPGGMGPTRGNMELKAEISPEQGKALMEFGQRAPSTSGQEVARMVLALASPMAVGMRGETVLVDAGLLLHLGGYSLHS
jgi:3-oxoacyl-[acyl-carrier protein] reductase